MKAGIYQILNLVNNKRYIGSSCRILQRISTHKYQLKYDNHSNKHLQFAYNKYGVDNFQFSILEECNNEELISKEQSYIDSFEFDTLYNMRPIAESSRGYKYPREVVEKRRLKQIGGKRSIETRLKMSIASKGRKGCKGRKFSAEEHERRKGTWLTGERHPQFGKTVSDYNKRRAIETHSIPIVQLDKEGNPIKEWPSTIAACRELNLHSSNISVCLNNGRQKTSGGFIWKYANKEAV